MDRMNMTADDRRVKARENMMDVFEDKYGEDWRDLMYGKDVDESLK
jgi:hypothetical protein